MTKLEHIANLDQRIVRMTDAELEEAGTIGLLGEIMRERARYDEAQKHIEKQIDRIAWIINLSGAFWITYGYEFRYNKLIEQIIAVLDGSAFQNEKKED